MGLQIGLLEALAGAAGEHARAVGVEPEERGDLARRLVLDLGVPQHGLPAFRQRPEGLHGHGLLGLVHRAHIGAEVEGVVVGDLGGACGLRGEQREVVDQLLPPGGLRPARGHPPDAGEQIGAHRVLGAVPAAHRLKHAGEDLGREVVRGVGVTAAGAGVPAHGVRMAPVQLLVRGVVARAHPHDQIGVGRRHVPRRGQHTVLVPVALRRDDAFGGVDGSRGFDGPRGVGRPRGFDGPDGFAALRGNDGLRGVAAPRCACPAALTRHLRRTAGLRVTVAQRPVPPVEAHRGKPLPPLDQPVPNTGSECHIGFCSGPLGADHPLVRGDLSCRSTGRPQFGEGSIDAHVTGVARQIRNTAAASRPPRRRVTLTPRRIRLPHRLTPAESATPPAGCPAAARKPPPAGPRRAARVLPWR